MKPVTLTLSTDERIALRRLANEFGKGLDEAAAIALRDWLIGNGYLETESLAGHATRDESDVGDSIGAARERHLNLLRRN